MPSTPALLETNGQILGARFAHRLDQRLRHAAEAEAAGHHRHAVLDQAGQRLVRAGVDFFHDKDFPRRRGFPSGPARALQGLLNSVSGAGVSPPRSRRTGREPRSPSDSQHPAVSHGEAASAQRAPGWPQRYERRPFWVTMVHYAFQRTPSLMSSRVKHDRARRPTRAPTRFNRSAGWMEAEDVRSTAARKTLSPAVILTARRPGLLERPCGCPRAREPSPPDLRHPANAAGPPGRSARLTSRAVRRDGLDDDLSPGPTPSWSAFPRSRVRPLE